MKHSDRLFLAALIVAAPHMSVRFAMGCAAAFLIVGFYSAWKGR